MLPSCYWEIFESTHAVIETHLQISLKQARQKIENINL